MTPQEQLIYNLFQVQNETLLELKKLNSCLSHLNKKIEMVALSEGGGEFASQALSFLKGLRKG